MVDHSAPDYPLEETLELGTDQVKVLYDDTRLGIIDLLSERAATTSQLAEALDRPKGTIGHHCKTLEESGLIRVVRTEQVRAITAKYYGRTARTFILDKHDGTVLAPDTMLGETGRELARSRAAGLMDGSLPRVVTLRHARIPEERAAEWERRLTDLAAEFTAEPRAGERSYALALSLFPTTRPTLAPAPT